MIKKLTCKLTSEQDKFWEKSFTDSLNNGDSELVADKKAFRDTKEKFPELKKYEVFE